jgi:hypothetical protein
MFGAVHQHALRKLRAGKQHTADVQCAPTESVMHLIASLWALQYAICCCCCCYWRLHVVTAAVPDTPITASSSVARAPSAFVEQVPSEQKAQIALLRSRA